MTTFPYSVDLDTVTAHIYTRSARPLALKTAVLFLLHGNPSSARHMKPIVDGVFEFVDKMSLISPGYPKRNLVVVTLELSTQKGRTKHDRTESEHVYLQQERMADAVSTLIDNFPAVLGPSYSETCDTWMVAGVSLGAHAAWMAMDRDPRLSVCIPVIGSPDFLDIATHRTHTATSAVPLVSCYMSSNIRSYIIKHDPVSRCRNPSQGISFVNKHVLALAGAEDKMIPFFSTRAFMDRIDVGSTGTKRLVIQEGVGHQCTREMVREMAELVWRVALV